MKRISKASFLAALIASGLTTSVSRAQCGPALTVQPKVIMEEQVETRYKVVYKTIYQDSEVVSQRPKLKYRTDKRMVTVAKPVTETSTEQVRYTVMTPVRKQEIVDQSYYKTEYVTETAQREEVYTTLRPVVETQYQTQQYVVPRQVTETQYQTQQYMSYAPVTTYQQQTVDAGQYVAQNYYVPGTSRYRLGFLPGGTAVDTATGLPFYHRSQFGWLPTQQPGAIVTSSYYQPNYQQIAVPQTSYMPVVQQQQVPVQVTRTENEVVQQQVPVNVTRMEPVQERRMVPYTTSRPVQQYVENKVPVERVEYVPQEIVQPKTVTRTTYKQETVEQEVQVGYWEMEEVRTPVRVPRTVIDYEPVEVRRMVPKTVYSPVTLNYYDPYSTAISQGYSSFLPILPAPTVTTAPATGSASPSDQANRTVQRVEIGEIPEKKDADKKDSEKTNADKKEAESKDSAGEKSSQKPIVPETLELAPSSGVKESRA